MTQPSSLFAIAAAITLIAGCATQYSVTDARALCIKKRGACSEALCRAAASHWLPADAFGGSDDKMICSVPTSDAGKTCFDSSECDTFCLASIGSTTGARMAGMCYNSASFFDVSYSRVENGIVGECTPLDQAMPKKP